MRRATPVIQKIHAGIVVFLLLLCGLTPAPAAGLAIEAQIDPARFTLDQEALLSVTITGKHEEEPELPKVQGLFFTPLGHATQIQWINGSMSSSLTLTYRVRADKTGQFTIAPITVRDGKKTAASAPLQVEVLPASAGTPVQPPPRDSAADTDQAGELTVDLKKETIYAGELVPITIRGFFRQDKKITVKGPPQLDGDAFILEALDEKPLQEKVMRNGHPMVRLTWHGKVSAIKKGDLPLRVHLPITVLVPQQRRIGSPLFNDPFFDLDNFFLSYRKKELTLHSEPRRIRVRPLPLVGRPECFSGAIGSFTLQTKAHPTDVKPGDPITLTMTISGSGNFDRVQSPVFTANPKDWKIYPPSRGKLGDTDKVDQQHKTFEQAIIPLHGKITDIPGVCFSFFDPEKARYITLHSSAIALNIQPGEDRQTAMTGIPQPGLSKDAEKNPPEKSTTRQDRQPGLALAPQRNELGSCTRTVHFLYQNKWFQIFIASSAVLLAVLFTLLWVQRRRDTNQEAMEQARLDRHLTSLLNQARQALESDESNRFFLLLRQAIQEYFGHRWQCEARAITAADIVSRLGMDTALTKALRAIEQAIYEQDQPGRDEMLRILAQVEEELDTE